MGDEEKQNEETAAAETAASGAGKSAPAKADAPPETAHAAAGQQAAGIPGTAGGSPTAAAESTPPGPSAATAPEVTAKPTGADAPAGAEQAPPLPDFTSRAGAPTPGSIDLLKDVELNVKIELGRTDMAVHEILHLTNGSVVELDKLAGDPVDVLVNEQLVARGEVLVVNENFCVRINEIIPGATEKLNQA